MSQPQHGAIMIDNQQAQFALWAPDASSVALQLADGTTTALEHTAQGWYQIRIPCEVGTAYRFVVNDHWHIPDPASRQQCDNIHGLIRLVEHQSFAWTRHGLMVYLDVIYNHFGPVGNYLTHYASDFFHDKEVTPWGPAIDFRRQQGREFFIQNALMWVLDYRVDGLRLDAVHAIIDDHGFLVELAQRVREAAGPDRHVHLMLENEHNTVSLLESGFDGPWNDDMHHVIHTILTGEKRGYYSHFTEDRTEKLQLCLRQGFAYQDSNEAAVQALPPSRFICYLQNHDQIGNRAFGERLTALADENRVWAASAMILLAPMTPMFFMGEELGSRQPFYFFTDHEPELADAVREGRRNEFGTLADPNDIGIYQASNPYRTAQADDSPMPAETPYLRRYREVLQLGGEVALEQLVRELRRHDMGLIVDVDRCADVGQTQCLCPILRHRCWQTARNEPYEHACDEFLTRLLSDPQADVLRQLIFDAVNKLAVAGALNSLTQCVLRMTTPGIPDLYQGAELWDLALVDPDNRRPVNFAIRQELLAQSFDVDRLLASWPNAAIKQAVIQRVLQARQQQPDLWLDGEYIAPPVRGTHAGRVLAFARSHGSNHAVVIVPIRSAQLLGVPHQPAPQPMVAPEQWKSTHVVLPEALRGRRLRSIYCDTQLTCAETTVPVGNLLGRFPVNIYITDSPREALS